MKHSVDNQGQEVFFEISFSQFRFLLDQAFTENKFAQVFRQRERENISRLVLFSVFFVYFSGFCFGNAGDREGIVFAQDIVLEIFKTHVYFILPSLRSFSISRRRPKRFKALFLIFSLDSFRKL